jgi:hypothetical protein
MSLTSCRNLIEHELAEISDVESEVIEINCSECSDCATENYPINCPSETSSKLLEVDIESQQQMDILEEAKTINNNCLVFSIKSKSKRIKLTR